MSSSTKWYRRENALQCHSRLTHHVAQEPYTGPARLSGYTAQGSRNVQYSTPQTPTYFVQEPMPPQSSVQTQYYTAEDTTTNAGAQRLEGWTAPYRGTAQPAYRQRAAATPTHYEVRVPGSYTCSVCPSCTLQSHPRHVCVFGILVKRSMRFRLRCAHRSDAQDSLLLDSNLRDSVLTFFPVGTLLLLDCFWKSQTLNPKP